MLKINVRVIPHNEQRYETVGDWWFDFNSESWEIRVSDMGNWKYEALVAIHEQHEVLLMYNRYCIQCGNGSMTITEMTNMVDNFDIEYEKTRAEDDLSEPGDHPLAPYRKEHFFATNLERLFAEQLGVDWSEYDKAVMSL